MKMNITQDLTINYDNNTVNRSAALITGYQDGKGYDDLEKIWQTVVDKFSEKKGEGSSDRGGWTLTSSSGSGTDAGDVIKGKASGTINTDYIGVITNITSSPGNLKEAIWNFGGSAVTITGTKDENNNPYLPEGLIPLAKDADKQAPNTSPATVQLIPQIKRKRGIAPFVDKKKQTPLMSMVLQEK